MTDVERAVQYIAIFLNVGDRWQSFVPVDADLVTDVSVRLGTVEMGPGGDGRWWLKDNAAGTTRWYGLRAEAVTS